MSKNITIDIPPSEIDPLTDQEEKELVKLEKLVSAGQAILAKSGVALVNSFGALKEIREKRLYRAHGTWEQYCRAKWKVAARTVELCLESYGIRKELSEQSETVSDLESRETKLLIERTSDKALRALAKEKPEKRMDTLKAAAKGKGKTPSAKAVHRAIAKRNHKPAVQKPLPLAVPIKQKPKGGLAAAAALRGAPKVKKEEERDYSDAYSSPHIEQMRARPAIEVMRSAGIETSEVQIEDIVCSVVAKWGKKYLNAVVKTSIIEELEQSIRTAFKEVA